jgi:predicted RNA-binding protein YlxR (DUF448 family)
MKKKKIPMRICVGCQEPKTKKELLRIVLTPEGSVEVDKTGKKAGRGAYICANVECLEKAYKEHRLERSLKTKVSNEIYESLRQDVQ